MAEVIVEQCDICGKEIGYSERIFKMECLSGVKKTYGGRKRFKESLSMCEACLTNNKR